MNAILLEIIEKSQQKLARKLTVKELEFIKWMVEKTRKVSE